MFKQARLLKDVANISLPWGGKAIGLTIKPQVLTNLDGPQGLGFKTCQTPQKGGLAGAGLAPNAQDARLRHSRMDLKREAAFFERQIHVQFRHEHPWLGASRQ